MSAKKAALGRGLGALLEGSSTSSTSIEKESSSVETVESNNLENGSVSLMLISKVEANPFQPRTHFEKEALEELTNSIKEHGVIQPITVRKVGGEKYQIISGERRFRASQAAGLKEIPVYIRSVDDQTMLEMAIVENVQRKDLNAIEVALSYQRLIDECNITQEKVGERVSKSRASVANYLRLLNLPDEVQAGIRDEKISMGHARALLAFDTDAEKVKVYRSIVDNSLSVRKVEELAKQSKEPAVTKVSSKKEIAKSVLKIKDNLSFHLGSKINISQELNGKGKIVIPFEDEEHLRKIIEALDN
jgi:ParB family chromosome partitioning protein